MEYDWNRMMDLVNENQIDKMIQLFHEMDREEYQYVRDKLLEELGHTKNKKHRNTIAIVLGDLGCNEAVPIMVDLINMSENKNGIGTLLYALQSLDCEGKIKDILPILSDGNFEVKYNMYQLFLEKAGNMSREEQLECLDIIEKYELREELEEFMEEVAFAGRRSILYLRD